MPVKNKPAYQTPTRRTLERFFYDAYFAPLWELFNEPLYNSQNDVINAIRSGRIKYQNGVFTGSFNSRISSTLSKFAKYDGRAKVWRVTGTIPGDIVAAATTANDKAAKLLKEAQRRIDEMDRTVPGVIPDLEYDIERQLNDVTKQATADLVNLGITPEFTAEQAAQLRAEYNESLNYYVQNWHQDQIVKLRDMVDQSILQGAGRQQIRDSIQNQWGVSANKAKFLARNETALLTSAIRDQRYQSAGVTKYRWSTISDGRQRELHAKLNRKVFSYDNPPVIDERTQKRGNPGQIWNCRCQAIPLIG